MPILEGGSAQNLPILRGVHLGFPSENWKASTPE